MNWPNLQMPESVEIEEKNYSNNFGRFILQPLERGFGVTMAVDHQKEGVFNHYL